MLPDLKGLASTAAHAIERERWAKSALKLNATIATMPLRPRSTWSGGGWGAGQCNKKEGGFR